MKHKPYRLVAAVRAEMDCQYDDLLLHSIPKADRLRSEIEAGFPAIAAKPTGFGYVRGYPFRSYGPTKAERYRIAYFETSAEIVIVAVYYSGAAQPLYWLDRAF